MYPMDIDDPSSSDRSFPRAFNGNTRALLSEEDASIAEFEDEFSVHLRALRSAFVSSSDALITSVRGNKKLRKMVESLIDVSVLESLDLDAPLRASVNSPFTNTRCWRR